MKINFLGNSSFEITCKEGVVALDPQGDFSNDSLLFAIFSREGDRSEFSGKRVIDWPGEFEFAKIQVKSMLLAGSKLLPVFEIENVRFALLANLDQVPSESEKEFFSNCDVLLLASGSLSEKDCKKIVEENDPRAVVFANPSEKLLGEFGLNSAERKSECEISKSKLPDDHTEFFVLESN